MEFLDYMNIGLTVINVTASIILFIMYKLLMSLAESNKTTGELAQKAADSAIDSFNSGSDYLKHIREVFDEHIQRIRDATTSEIRKSENKHLLIWHGQLPDKEEPTPEGDDIPEEGKDS